MAKKILVVGGTGMLGQPVVRRLLKDNYDVRVMTHSPVKARKIFDDRVECIEGDVTNIASLEAPLSGCEAVYINLGAKMNPVDYERIEYQGTANIVKAARAGEVGQIGMISGLTVKAGKDDVDFIKWKAKAEKALIESGIPYTIFRCCWFFESLPLFVVKNQATLFGKQPHKRAWIAASDYAGMVSRAFDNSKALDKIFHVKGIDKYSISEALDKFCSIAYPTAKSSRIPLWLASVLVKFSSKGAMRGIVDFMKYFDKTPDPETANDSEGILGPALTTLEDWAREYKMLLGQ
ncbi:MAG: NAD(P)H-binding protein [Candidatus Zixiibacteriota bacterium]